VLQGGRAVALWPWKRRGAKLEVTLEPLEPLRSRTTVERELKALARYLGAELDLTMRSRP
jgi:hypothetical protein